MDQCSRHDIPPAVTGDLTDRQGHDLGVELKALDRGVLTYRRLRPASLPRTKPAVHPPLEITTVYVTHDQVEAMTMGDRVAVMKDGVLQQVDAPLELYDDPVNLFVAGFIGSPAMNLLEGELTDQGAMVFGHVMEIPLTPDARRRHTGGVTIGIRPEYFRVAADDIGLPVTVTVVEELGADAYVYGTAGPRRAAGDGEPATGTPVVARIETRSKIQRGATIHVTVKPENCRVFATETGERLDARR